MKHRGVELHEFHICHGSLGTVGHGDAIACSDDGIRGGQVDGPATTSAEHRDLREVGVHLLLRIEHIGPIAVDMWRATGDSHAEMVLGDDLNGKVILLDVDVGAGTHGLHQPPLYLCARIIGMVQDTELRVASLTVKGEVTLLVLVEVDSPLLHSLAIADVIARNHRVLDVLVEVVQLQVCHTGHTSLRKRGVRLVEGSLTDQTHTTFLLTRHLQGIAHTGHTSTDNEEIILVNHDEINFMLQRYKIIHNS